MYPKDFRILISDQNFINKDGTLIKTDNLCKVSVLDKNNFIYYNFFHNQVTIDFISKREAFARFFVDKHDTDFMLKERFLIENPRDSRFQTTTREKFISALSNFDPAFGNWLIWNHL